MQVKSLVVKLLLQVCQRFRIILFVKCALLIRSRTLLIISGNIPPCTQYLLFFKTTDDFLLFQQSAADSEDILIYRSNIIRTLCFSIKLFIFKWQDGWMKAYRHSWKSCKSISDWCSMSYHYWAVFYFW